MLGREERDGALPGGKGLGDDPETLLLDGVRIAGQVDQGLRLSAAPFAELGRRRSLVVLHDTLSDEDRTAAFGRGELELSSGDDSLSSVGSVDI